MNETQNIKMQPAPAMFRDRAVLVSVGLLIAAAAFFFIVPFSTVYWLRRTYYDLGNSFLRNPQFGIVCVQFLIIAGIWFVTGRYLVSSAASETARYAVMSFLGLATVVSIIGVIIGGIFVIFLDRTLLSSTTLGENRYHLERHIGDYAEYVLFRCDSLDFACDEVTSIPVDYRQSGSPQLVADLETNTLSIVIDGIIIDTYTPQE